MKAPSLGGGLNYIEREYFRLLLCLVLSSFHEGTKAYAYVCLVCQLCFTEIHEFIVNSVCSLSIASTSRMCVLFKIVFLHKVHIA